MSTTQELQSMGLTSIDIQTSHTHTTSNPSLTPEPSENTSVFHEAVLCVIWIVVKLGRFLIWVLKTLYQSVFWVLKTLFHSVFNLLQLLVEYYFYCFLFVVFLPVICFVAALCSLTFPFLLVSLLVLRILQFIKRGEDYDRVTQVKMLIEWYLFIDCVLIAIGIWLFLLVFSKKVSVLKEIKILGPILSNWGNHFCSNLLAVFGIRFILFWIIQKFMPRMALEHNESGLKLTQAASDIVDCLLFWYYVSVIMDYVPSFSQHNILGLFPQKWIEVTVFIVIGWNIIAVSTHLIVWSIHRLVSRYLDHVHDDKERSHRYLLLERLLRVQCLVYYGNGMKRSINFMLGSLLLLLVWVFYFGVHMKKTGVASKAVWEFGTWTCFVLLILSFLWVLKDFVLLSWEANAVYNRLSSRILEARKSVYFLGILGRHSHDILKLRYEVVEEGGGTNGPEEQNKRGAQIFLAKNLGRVDTCYRDKKDEDDNDEKGGSRVAIGQLKPKLSNKKRARVKHDLLVLKNDTMTMFHLQQLAEYFLAAASSLLKETYTSDLLRKLNSSGDVREMLENLIRGKSNVRDVSSSSTESSVKETSEDWKCFQGLLGLKSANSVEGTSEDHSKVKTWMEKSHNKCIFLANTLSSAKEVVNCLDNIISVLLIVASFVIWLICTGLADTKVLVLVASPLLAATFIFGDTCKGLFQGIIFVYVVHPLDVGDLCVIDQKLMEVRAIGVWKTSFSKIDKVGTHEEVIYPNSELAMKVFINHRTEFDWSESVEFDVEYLDNQQIKKLKYEIEGLLDAKKDDSMPGSHSVAVMGTGKEIKIAVRFKHNKRNVDLTYYECVKEKENLRSVFILDVQKLVNREKENKKLAEQSV